MKNRFDFERLMNDWVFPLAIVAIVVWLVIWISGGKPKTKEEQPEPTPEPVIVQMVG